MTHCSITLLEAAADGARALRPLGSGQVHQMELGGPIGEVPLRAPDGRLRRARLPAASLLHDDGEDRVRPWARHDSNNSNNSKTSHSNSNSNSNGMMVVIVIVVVRPRALLVHQGRPRGALHRAWASSQ